jgi:hypothetical protein
LYFKLQNRWFYLIMQKEFFLGYTSEKQANRIQMIKTTLGRQKSLPRPATTVSGDRNPCRDLRRLFRAAETFAATCNGFFGQQKPLPQPAITFSGDRNHCRDVRQLFQLQKPVIIRQLIL